jgi:hypothetical protein
MELDPILAQQNDKKKPPDIAPSKTVAPHQLDPSQNAGLALANIKKAQTKAAGPHGTPLGSLLRYPHTRTDGGDEGARGEEEGGVEGRRREVGEHEGVPDNRAGERHVRRARGDGAGQESRIRRKSRQHNEICTKSNPSRKLRTLECNG